jgi:16S rRNA processing protein RimM
MVTAPMPATPQRLRAVHVRRPHGVRGELRVEPLGGDASRFQPGMLLYPEREPQRAYTVAAARPTAEGDVLLSLREIASRTDAEQLRDAYLCVEGDARRTLGAQEWFVWELVGLRVADTGGAVLGVVDDVESYAEQDVLVVRRPDGGETRIPMVRAHVAAVDVAAGQITVTPWVEEEA